MTLPNQYHVKKLEYNTAAFVYCPLGKDWGNVEIKAEIEIDNVLPDYLDIDNFILTEIEGRTHITEEVGYLVWKFITDMVDPKHCKVIVHSNNPSMHACWTTIE